MVIGYARLLSAPQYAYSRRTLRGKYDHAKENDLQDFFITGLFLQLFLLPLEVL